MAASVARLTTPVTATVTTSFNSFKEGEQVVIDRVTTKALWYGAKGRQEFIPCQNVDEKAKGEIRRQI